MHVDEFIDRFTPITKLSPGEREAERYARWVLMLLRLPAALALDFKQWIPRLFCDYEGKRFRVVFASRMGWIGLTPDFDDEKYRVQVDVMRCSNWGAEP